MENKNDEKTFEVCAMCGCTTDVKRTTPIEQRKGYVEGCGQLCKNCFEQIGTN